MDVFEFDNNNVGQIQKLRVGHDNAGLGPGWHLARIMVENLNTGECVTFECNRWFDRKEDDGQIERELFPTSGGIGYINWRMTVVTGGWLPGCALGLLPLQLLHMGGCKTRSRCMCEVAGRHCPRLWGGGRHGGWGSGAFRTLGSMDPTVRNPYGMQAIPPTPTAPPNNYLYSPQIHLKPPLTVTPLLPPASPPPPCTPGSDMGAGTDADVFTEIHGTHANFGPHMLAAQKKAFETGGRDTFSISTPELGQVVELVMGHNNKGIGAAWQLDTVELENMKSGEAGAPRGEGGGGRSQHQVRPARQRN